MALNDKAWYINFGDGSTTGYFAATKWAASTTKHCGNLVRQNTAPAVGSERIFVCIASTGGTGQTNTSEPSWTVTRGAKITDNTVTWQEATGIAALNGDLTNTPNWNAVKNTAITLGQVIQNVAGTLILICTTAGTAGNGAEPSWAAFTNAGATTSDNTATWTTLGASFSAWAAPHARLANAYAANWGQAGNDFYIGDNSAETSAAAITITAPGTTASPTRTLCVDHTVAPPTSSNLKTTATITSSVAGGGAIVASCSGASYNYGFSLIASNATLAANSIQLANNANVYMRFEACTMNLSGNSAAGGIQVGYVGTSSCPRVDFVNTVCNFGNTGQSVFLCGVVFTWRNTASALTGSAVTALFSSGTGATLDALVEGVDLSLLGSAKALVAGAGFIGGYILFKDCKLGASVTAITGTLKVAVTVDLVRCDSGTLTSRTERHSFQGDEITDTTVVRTGGATDGSQGFSHKITTLSTNYFYSPFAMPRIAKANLTTGVNVSFTIHGVWNSASLPNNDDIWIEAEYLGSASTPMGSFANTTKSNVLSSNAAVSADTAAWDSGVTARANTHSYNLGDIIKTATNPGRIFYCTSAGTSAGSEPAGYASAVDGGSVTDSGATFRAATRFSMQVTMSSPQPQLAGLVFISVFIAKVSATFNVDPSPS